MSAPLLTLGGGLSIGAGQGHHALVHLDADHLVALPDQLGEQLAVVRLLVERLVEEDDAADAGCHAVVGREQQLAVQPAVLLRVLRVDALEALGDGAWRRVRREGRMEGGGGRG